MLQPNSIERQIKKINYKLRYWRRFYPAPTEFSEARRNRAIREKLLEQRNEYIKQLK